MKNKRLSQAGETNLIGNLFVQNAVTVSMQ
jgi:hypothetical protein